MGKRFKFGIVTIVCATIATCILRYSGNIYLEIVKWVCGLYIGGQTVTDFKKYVNGKKEGV